MFFGKQNAVKRGTEIYPYVIDSVLSSSKGGMAQLYIAHEKGKNEKIALKISAGTDPVFEEALRSEVVILRKISNPNAHPNIIKILPIPIASKYPYPMMRAINLPGQPWYYVMEYLSGHALSSYVSGSKGFPEQVALIIVAKISSALNHIHQQGVAHLDVKTENIVMRFPLKRGNMVEPVLIDFGVAAKSKEPQTDSGSLAFMPPERLAQLQRQIAPEFSAFHLNLEKVDVYALGVSFFEMMTGRLPFGGLTRKGLTTAILKHELSRPRNFRTDISKRTEQLILAMLDVDSVRRPSFDEIGAYIGNRDDHPLEFDIPMLKKGG